MCKPKQKHDKIWGKARHIEKGRNGQLRELVRYGKKKGGGRVGEEKTPPLFKGTLKSKVLPSGVDLKKMEGGGHDRSKLGVEWVRII